MKLDPIAIDTDVLVIGSGAAGMYAAIEAARNGARVLLADRNLIGRGGATVMAQMTVACALGEETPDTWQDHYADTIAAGRGLCDETLAQLLWEEARGRRRGPQGRPHHRHHGARPRPAALRLCGFHQHGSRSI